MRNVREWELVRITYGLGALPPMGYVAFGISGALAAILLGAFLCFALSRTRSAIRELPWYRWCLASALAWTALGVIATSLLHAQWVLIVWFLGAVAIPLGFIPFFENTRSESEVRFRRG
jgi:hypothetical protein